MICRLAFSLSALLATAGGAFTGSTPAAAEAGQRIRIGPANAEVETLIVSSRGVSGDDASGLESQRSTEPMLMVGLHGYGMEASQISTLVDLDPAFDHVYLAPEGFHRLPDGSRAWFPITWQDDEMRIAPRDLTEFADRLENYVHAAAERFGTGRIAIVGYSQGGAAAIYVAMHRSALAEAFVSLAGSVLAKRPAVMKTPEAKTPEARLFIGHGTQDAWVSTEEIRDDVEGLRRLGLDVTFREYAVPHVVSAAQRRDVAAWLADF